MKNIEIAFDSQHNRRLLGSTEVVIHCHHYNCQLQDSIEASQYIDGTRLIKDASSSVFGSEFEYYLKENPLHSNEEKWQFALKMYKTHGFGTFDWQNVYKAQIFSSSSHFAEGWKAKFGISDTPRCSLTCGFIEAIYSIITGNKVQVNETQCMAMGHERCIFEIVSNVDSVPQQIKLNNYENNFIPSLGDSEIVKSDNVDEESIIKAIASIPVYGDEQGLIPMFGIYATNIPAEYYNRISFLYESEMAKGGDDVGESARSLLIFGGEVCGLHTFHGIMASQEWESLVIPMIQNREDNIFALIAITNAFGWGNWHIKELQPRKSLVLRSYNGYEALGYRKMFGISEVPRCYMLTGVSAGLMELIYSSGTLEDKFGKFQALESKCIAKGDPYCEFVVKKL